jgi:hypothetical protein
MGRGKNNMMQPFNAWEGSGWGVAISGNRVARFDSSEAILFLKTKPE